MADKYLFWRPRINQQQQRLQQQQQVDSLRTMLVSHQRERQEQAGADEYIRLMRESAIHSSHYYNHYYNQQATTRPIPEGLMSTNPQQPLFPAAGTWMRRTGPGCNGHGFDHIVVARQPNASQLARWNDQYFVHNYLTQPPDSNGDYRMVSEYTPYVFAEVTEEQKAQSALVKEGSTILFSGLSRWFNGKRAYAVKLLDTRNGERWFKVFMPNSGVGEFPERFLILDPVSLVPDKTGHIHEWEMRWDGTFRKCTGCLAREWALACWTDNNWAAKAPTMQMESHPTLTHEKVSSQQEPGWVSAPHRTRSFDLIPESALSRQIHVIGAGAIGSFTVLNLVKMGFENITVWDDDTVAIENVGTQLYGNRFVVEPPPPEGWEEEDFEDNHPILKVDALSELVNDDLGPHEDFFTLTTMEQKFPLLKFDITQSSYSQWPNWLATRGVFFIFAVDSMAARKEIFESLYAFVSTFGLERQFTLIDARMGAENASMYTMRLADPKDIETYRKTLHSDNDVLNEPCTAAGTVYTASLMAGMVCKAVKDIVTNNKKYARVMHWDIENNHQVVYHKKHDTLQSADSTALCPSQPAGNVYAQRLIIAFGAEINEVRVSDNGEDGYEDDEEEVNNEIG